MLSARSDRLATTVSGGPVCTTPRAFALAHLSISDLAELYEGLRLWAPCDLAAQHAVATELRRRTLDRKKERTP